MGVTLKDIGREAGVSAALVSYYLNGSKTAWMSENTRKRIGDAIVKLNYKPNRLARSLRTGKSRNIGLLVGNISDSYFGHLAEEALEAARIHDYSLIFSVVKRHVRDEKSNAVEFLMRNQIEALLTCLSLEELPEKKILLGSRIPIVRFAYQEPDAISLMDDVRGALEDACRYLKERGHKSMFGYFDTHLPWNSFLIEAAKKAEIELIHRSYISPGELQSIYQYIAETRPRAILLNGRTLYEVLSLIGSMDGYAPDIIIGLDEFRTLRESPLIVGGIRTRTTEKARRGIELLIERLEHPELPREGIVMLTSGQFIRY